MSFCQDVLFCLSRGVVLPGGDVLLEHGVVLSEMLTGGVVW